MNSDNIVFEEFENNGTVGQLCRFPYLIGDISPYSHTEQH